MEPLTIHDIGNEMLSIENEFKALIPPLQAEEKAQLEANILADGCREPLVVWGNTLLDGHNRYEICTRHNIKFDVINHNFEDKSHATEWIIKNQFGRRNLPSYVRTQLALRLEDVIAARAKENQVRKPADSVSQNSVKQNPVDTQKELAKLAGVSHDTVAKVKHIERDALPEIKEFAAKGAISVHLASEVASLPVEEQEIVAATNEQHVKEVARDVVRANKAHVSNNSGNNEWYTPSKYIEMARNVMGSIDTDPASSEIANQTVKAKTFFTEQSNGLKQSWDGNVWMNPPYAQPLIALFSKAINDKYLSGEVSQAVVLVNNATETVWFQTLIANASAVCFPKGRIRFISPAGERGDTPLQGQAIVYFGENVDSFVNEFSPEGMVLRHV